MCESEEGHQDGEQLNPRDFSLLECFVWCVYMCGDVNMSVRVQCFREKGCVEKHRTGEGGGRVMAMGGRLSTRLFCSLLFILSQVQLLARGQPSDTLRQGALARLDPWI